MQNKFDQITPLIGEPAESQEFVVGQVVSQLPLSTLELFKKRLDHWTQTDVSPFEKKYDLGSLFNQYLTVAHLKAGIRSLKDLIYILSHAKMSIENRYLLLHKLATVFPKDYPNTVLAPHCDDQFMALLIKNKNDFDALINLITEYPLKQRAIQFQMWAISTSSYLQNLMVGNYEMAPSAPFFIAPKTNPYQPMTQPVYLQPQKQLSIQPLQVQQPVNQLQEPLQEVNTVLNTFIDKVKRVDRSKMNAHKHFESLLFDKQLTVSQLKSAIHNLNDLLRIFDECKLASAACYAVVNFLISEFPIANNKNANHRAHPCDEHFLEKIIHSKGDIDKICSYMVHNKRVPFVNRLIHCSSHGKKILAGQVTPPQKNNTSSFGFFASNIQSNVVLPPKQTTQAPWLIGEDNLKPVERESPKARQSPEIAEPRAEKRAKNNLGEAIERRKIDDSEHPLGRLSIFFTQQNNAPHQIEEPAGGEYEYFRNDSGNVMPIL
ncbi:MULTISPECIES: hypothetical protein [Legionella]|uniref:hypothetical protein n=1 Tax=Legionella TaxID=445 RepID=UPI000967CBA3|nr:MULTISPECIES: hypothetical protein [Legionella]MBN9226312.1 hypothetical protein [Legionella steelei]OJW12055.1 MAG: hypothetical protein BGO44_03210 [Legionella sp. 39-23]